MGSRQEGLWRAGVWLPKGQATGKHRDMVGRGNQRDLLVLVRSAEGAWPCMASSKGGRPTLRAT